MSKQSDDAFLPDDNEPAADQQRASDDLQDDAPPEDQNRDVPAADSTDAVELAAESLQAELEVARQRALRIQAELENYRKRAQRTLEEERRYACLPLMRDLLTVVDNLQRAIEAAQQNESAAGLLEGVTLVADQLSSILKKHHCQEIPAAGSRFDPHLHEAIAQFPSEDHEPGEIAQVTQVGYQLHDRVIRPSQVIVAAARPETNDQVAK